MKRRALAALALVGWMALFVSKPLCAEENKSADDFQYKKSGLILGGELGALVGFDGGVYGAPGKLDLLVGYQVNPYFSIGADLWTFWFIAYAGEAHAKVNFTDGKISPYAVGTVGVVRVLTVLDEGEGGATAFTYSAGLGLDLHLWRHGTLFAEAKYRGGMGMNGDSFSDAAHGLEAGVGFRWTF